MSASKVIIHGNEWEQAHIQESIEYCLTKKWSRQRWAKKPQSKPTKIHPHDHCEICWWELFETNEDEHSLGYTDGYHWICSECFHKFIEPKIIAK
ncbi:MAG: hypothetical protein HOP33_22985 [Verrucomicrobia bacterium]|nr:hypothetical protein [Verrucomicrobiota bacterium]